MNTILGSSRRSSNLVGTSIAGTSVTIVGMEGSKPRMELPTNFCGAGGVSSAVKGRAEGLISSVKSKSSVGLDSFVELDSDVVLIDSVCND